jgi:drug/metabolite transporter (DMT)-like permease
MKFSKSTRTYISAVLAMIFWSMTFIWFKLANKVFPPFSIVLIRLVISSVILLTGAIFIRRLQKIERRDWKWIILLAVFEPFLYFIGESLGLTIISSTQAAVIIGTIPLLVPVGAYLFFREKLSLLNMAGIIISFTGLLIVVLKRGFAFNVNPTGVMLLFLAVFSAVGYTLMVRKLVVRYNPYSLVTYQNILGIIFFFPLVAVFEFESLISVDVTNRALISLFCLAIFGSTLAFILYNYSIKNLGASKANIFTNIIPVLTAVFSFYILNEEMSFRKVTGIAVVLAGLFLSQLKKMK